MASNGPIFQQVGPFAMRDHTHPSLGGVAGTNKQIQYNDNNNMAGASGFAYDKATGNVGIGTESPHSDLKLDIVGNIGVSGYADISALVSGPAVVPEDHLQIYLTVATDIDTGNVTKRLVAKAPASNNNREIILSTIIYDAPE